jgi:hypothetical protein
MLLDDKIMLSVDNMMLTADNLVGSADNTVITRLLAENIKMLSDDHILCNQLITRCYLITCYKLFFS